MLKTIRASSPTLPESYRPHNDSLFTCCSANYCLYPYVWGTRIQYTLNPYVVINYTRLVYKIVLNQLFKAGSLYLLQASLMLTWVDHRLRWELRMNWNASLVNELQPSNKTMNAWLFEDHAELPGSFFWLPMFKIANCQRRDCEVFQTNETDVMVFNDGTVEMRQEALLEARCDVDLTLFPVDEQKWARIKALFLQNTNKAQLTKYSIPPTAKFVFHNLLYLIEWNVKKTFCKTNIKLKSIKIN